MWLKTMSHIDRTWVARTNLWYQIQDTRSIKSRTFRWFVHAQAIMLHAFSVVRHLNLAKSQIRQRGLEVGTFKLLEILQPEMIRVIRMRWLTPLRNAYRPYSSCQRRRTEAVLVESVATQCCLSFSLQNGSYLTRYVLNAEESMVDCAVTHRLLFEQANERLRPSSNCRAVREGEAPPTATKW